MKILRKHHVCWHGSEDFCSYQDYTKFQHSDFRDSGVFNSEKSLNQCRSCLCSVGQKLFLKMLHKYFDHSHFSDKKLKHFPFFFLFFFPGWCISMITNVDSPILKQIVRKCRSSVYVISFRSPHQQPNNTLTPQTYGCTAKTVF